MLSQTVQIARFSIPLWLLGAAAGLAVAYIVIRVYFRADTKSRRAVFDILLSAFIVFLNVWKLSPALFRLRQIIQQPSALLYLPGGLAGTAAGIACALVYLAVALYRRRPVARRTAVGLSAGTGATVLVFLLFAAIGSIAK